MTLTFICNAFTPDTKNETQFLHFDFDIQSHKLITHKYTKLRFTGNSNEECKESRSVDSNL